MNKPKSKEYEAFEGILGRVLSVSKTELSKRIADEKSGKRSAKSDPSSRVPVSSAKRD
jgi:hypothetical protein